MSAVSHSEHGMRARLPTPAAWRRMLDVVAARRGRLPIAAKLILSYLLIIAVAVVVFVVVGTQLVGRLILSEAQSSGSNARNAAARTRKVPIAAVSVMAAGDLRQESAVLADRAYFRFIPTPKARPRRETEETSGMVLEAVAPILDYRSGLIGFLYGGVLQNRNYEIVDKVKETVFQGLRYGGRDVGTATIFLDDVRIATNVLNAMRTSSRKMV